MADIYGKIIAVLPTRSGTSARCNQWSSQTAVIETQEQYPKKLAFDVMNEKITEFNLQVGEFVTVSYDFDANEYQGRWFNNVRAWNVQRAQPGNNGGSNVPPQSPVQQSTRQWPAPGAGAQAAAAANPSNFPPPPPTGANAAPAGAQGTSDDLPF